MQDRGPDKCIRDGELYTTVVRNVKRGSRLHCLFDCCHSGTAMDLPFVARRQSRKSEVLLEVSDQQPCASLLSPVYHAFVAIALSLFSLSLFLYCTFDVIAVCLYPLLSCSLFLSSFFSVSLLYFTLLLLAFSLRSLPSRVCLSRLHLAKRSCGAGCCE